MRALAGIVLLLAFVPSADATTYSVTRNAGIVGATLIYGQGTDSFGNPTFADESLQIRRAGRVFYDQPVTSRFCAARCPLLTDSTAPTFGGPLVAADLEHSGEPNLILGLYTGGAHCCEVLQFFSYDPRAMLYGKVERNFGDPGATIRELRGRRELFSADDHFAYQFTSFAYSGLPLQIFHFSRGHFLDITRSFPKLIASDARRWFFRYTQNRRAHLGLGELAAWAADEYLLGKRRLVARTLDRQLRLGLLRRGPGSSTGGRQYIKALESFLRRNGY